MQQGSHVSISDRKPIPGATRVHVKAVRIVAPEGQELSVDYAPLYDKLGLRKGNFIKPERKYNPFRLAEDRRRIEAYLHTLGRFDAKVDEPKVKFDDKDRVEVTWDVHEGEAYRVAAVNIETAPPEQEAMLQSMVTFGPGDLIDLEAYRPLRRRMAERLQDEGYGHARVYSRTFAHRDSKKVHLFYYVDAGPRTRIRSIKVAGNARIPEGLIRNRVGLAVGSAYSTKAKRRAELALLDTGAFASVLVTSNSDILRDHLSTRTLAEYSPLIASMTTATSSAGVWSQSWMSKCASWKLPPGNCAWKPALRETLLESTPTPAPVRGCAIYWDPSITWCSRDKSATAC